MNHPYRSTRSTLAALAVVAAAAAACRAEPDDPYALQARTAMASSVAARFRIDPAMLEVRGFDQAVWTDDCYGIEQDRACTPGTFFGYEIEARVDGADYVYHASADDPSQLMLAEAPDPAIGDPALDARWLGVDGVCQSLWMAADGLAGLGLCGGPHAAHGLLGEMERPQEWQHFFDRFSAFELVSEDRLVAFQGVGAEMPSMAWQRAIAAWASLQWFELQAGMGDLAAGRMLAVRRPAAPPLDECWLVEVFEYGRAFVSRGPCSGDAMQVVGSTWIGDAAWERLANLYVSWSPLIELERAVEFRGLGEAPVGPRERAELVAFADELIRAAGGEVVP